jgi:5'-nucleotidase
MAKRPLILLTNDDGIDAAGLAALSEALSDLGKIVIVAPSVEQSAVGHAITLSDPLRVKAYTQGGRHFGYAVDGTPADCVKIAFWALLERPPELLVSGINLGANTGINALYSGTVSAATEGAFLGIPSFAVSLATYTDPDFSFSAKFAHRIARMLLKRALKPGITLNVNVPAVPDDQISGVAVTRQGQAMFEERFDKRVDPRGHIYYWLTGQKKNVETDVNVDDGAIQANYVSITPVHYDLTDHESLETLRSWSFDLSNQ